MEQQLKFIYKNIKLFFLKGVFGKNERGYKLDASIRRKLLKTTHTEERSAHADETLTSDRKQINLYPNKSFRYYKQSSSVIFRRILIWLIFHNIFDFVVFLN